MSYFENNEKVDEWLMKRRTKFTSSENFKLHGKGTNTLWSAGAMTYIETKVIELTTQVWERLEIDEVESLLHGKVYEYPAYTSYINETKNYSMTYMGTENPIFIPSPTMPEESGGTPDIANIKPDSSIDYLSEIKCPKNPAYHFRRLKWTSQWDIKEQYISCYTQMQHLMMVTGAFGCDFISYDERQLIKSKKIKIIEVKPDQKFMDNLEIRIQLAVKEKYKLLSEHYGTEIKNRTAFLELIKQ